MYNLKNIYESGSGKKIQLIHKNVSFYCFNIIIFCRKILYLHFFISTDLGINNIFSGLFSSSGSSSYHGQTEAKRMSVGVDEVTSGDGVSVGMGQGGGVSVGHSGSSHNGGMVSYGGGIGHGSDLTDRINETILIVIFGESLKIDILQFRNHI